MNMLRLLFVFGLFCILGSFVSSQKNSKNQTSGTADGETLSRVGSCRDGKDGRDGHDGKDGRDGRDGKSGTKGDKGMPGTCEAQSPMKACNCCENVSSFGNCRDGKDGRDGRDGRSGAKGEQGNPGLRGGDGSSGLKGQKGDLGMPGQKGVPGACDTKILSRINSLDKELKKILNASKQNSSHTSSKPTIYANESSTGFHFFEKVQDLPTKGASAVKHFKIEGNLFLAFANYHGDIHKYKTTSMIYKMEDSTGRFTIYQTLQTRGAFGLEYFSIADKHFLAVAYHYDGTYKLDTVIYQWNGNRFVVFQNIPTNGATHFAFFTIEGEKYLAVANHHNGRTQSVKSVIYRWKTDKFDTFQEIATEGARRCTVFVINNDTFIAFANQYNPQQKYYVHSSVFKWSGGHFVKLQILQTYGAHDVKYFEINGLAFLAFANHFSGSKYNIDSFIYKWDGSKFVLFQSISTRGAIALHSFVISGQTYLGVANHHGDNQKCNTLSVVYQASGAQFTKYQEIPTHGAHGMTSFEYKGHTYLAVANRYDGQHYNINSTLYKWV